MLVECLPNMHGALSCSSGTLYNWDYWHADVIPGLGIWGISSAIEEVVGQSGIPENMANIKDSMRKIMSATHSYILTGGMSGCWGRVTMLEETLNISFYLSIWMLLNFK